MSNPTKNSMISLWGLYTDILHNQKILQFFEQKICFTKSLGWFKIKVKCEYDDVLKRLIGEHSNKVFKIGDKVKVRCILANKEAGRIDFELV